MQAEVAYFHCGDQLRATLANEIREVLSAIAAVQWIESFSYTANTAMHQHQSGYNRAFALSFSIWGGSRSLLSAFSPD